jgi:hypothetical protein
MNDKESEQAKKFQEYLKTRGFVIPPNGKFKLNACDCGICK